MTKDELLAEEYICNGKCQDDITRNYVHCKTCTRLKDFLAGYKAGKATLEKENAELKEQISNVRECFISASSGDDFEMAESAREVMEVLDIPCYRHKDKREKSKLTKAKELLAKWVELFKPKGGNIPPTPIQVDTEQFLSELKK